MKLPFPFQLSHLFQISRSSGPKIIGDDLGDIFGDFGDPGAIAGPGMSDSDTKDDVRAPFDPFGEPFGEPGTNILADIFNYLK